MSNIDKRVVQMQFDNKQFEQGIQTSVKSLDDLKKGLDLKGSARSLAELDRAGKSFSLAGIANGVESLSNRFSTMGIAGMRAIENIVDSAMNAGKRIASALTIDPVKTGFSEYETQQGAIQTILANTQTDMKAAGMTDAQRLAKVNGNLAELNAYADKTIYNFTEMTKNIGTFTAAGVEIDKATASIKGIANLAAVSGSNAQQASTAMYQLSQAISSGTVRLMDWNSVQNAGMGGEIFQKALQRTAKNMGVVGKEAQKSFAKLQKGTLSFRDSLQSGWLTDDILTETLSQMSIDVQALADSEGIALDAAKELAIVQLRNKGYSQDDAEAIIELAQLATDSATKVRTFTQLFDTLKEAAQSGWSQTWQLIVGDFLEATQLLTDINNYFSKIIGSSAEARNKVLTEWRELGGRQLMIDSFWNIVHSIENVVNVFKKSFADVFPPTTGQTLKDISQKFADFTAKIKAFTENKEAMDKVGRFFKGIASALDIVKMAISWVWTGFKKLVGVMEPAGGSFLDFIAGIGDFLVGIRDAIKNSKLFQDIIAKVGLAFGAARDFIVSIGNAIGGVFSDLWAKAKESGIITQIGEKFSAFLSGIPAAIATLKEWGLSVVTYVRDSKILQNTWAKIKEFAGPVVAKIEEYAAAFRAAVMSFFGADTSGKEKLGDKLNARLEAFKNTLSGQYEEIKVKVETVWTNIKQFFTNFFTKTVPEFFSKISEKFGGFIKGIGQIDFGAIIRDALSLFAVFEAASFMRSFGKIGKGVKNIGKGFLNIGKSLNYVGDGIKDVVKHGIKFKKQDSLGSSLLKIAAAIGILVASIYVLAKMENGEIVKGLGVLTILAVELLAISVLFQKVGNNGKSIMQMAFAVALMIIPVKMLGDMDTTKALKGIFGLGIILTELAIFMRVAGKGFEKKAGLVAMAVAIDLIVLAVKGLAKLSIGGILQGLAGLGIILFMLGAFINKTQGLTKKAGGLITMAIAINLLSIAVATLGHMKTKNLAKGIGAIAVMMGAFSLLAHSAKGMKLGSSLLLLLTIAGTLYMFVTAFKELQGIDANSMLAFAGSLSAILLSLTIAMAVMSKMNPGMALKGIANIGIMIGGMTLIVTALGGINDAFGGGLVNTLESGGKVLQKVGKAIGMFIGGIGSGLVEGLDLPSMGTQLSAFMTNAQGFIEGAKKVDSSTIAGVTNLAGAVLAIAGTEFLAALVTLFTGQNPITSFSADILKLGMALTGYAFTVAPMGMVSADTVTRSVTVAQALADVSSKLTSNVMSFLTGTASLTTFASGLGILAPALVGFCTELSKVNEGQFNQSKVDALVSVAKGLAAMESGLEGQGGLEDAIEGVKSLSGFGTELPLFADGLNKFIAEVGKITFDPNGPEAAKLTALVEIAKSLSEMEKGLEAQGGWEDSIEGVKSLAGFGQELPDFATGLNRFIDQVTLIKYDPKGKQAGKLAALMEIATNLSTLEKGLQGQNGYEQAITGVKSLAGFGDSLPTFADGLNKFILEVAKINYDPKGAESDKMAALVALTTSLSDIEKNMEAQGGWDDFIFGTKDLGLFSTNLTSLATAMGSFVTNVQNIDTSKNANATDLLTWLSTFISSLTASGGVLGVLNTFLEGDTFIAFSTLLEKLKTMGENLNSFSTNVMGVDSTKTAAATTIIEDIGTFMNTLTKEGSIWQAIGSTFGAGSVNATMDNLLRIVGSMGTNFGSLNEGMKNIVNNKLQFSSIEDILKSVSGLGTTYKDYVSNGGLDNIGSEMVTLSSNFKSFGDNMIATTIPDNVNSMVQIIKDFAGLAVDLNGVQRTFDLPDMIKWLAAHGKDFINNTSNVDPEKVRSMGQFIKNLAESAILANGVTDTSLTSVQQLLDSFGKLTIPDFNSSGSENALGYISGLVTGLQNGVSAIKQESAVLSLKGHFAVNDTYKVWYQSGQYLARGLSKGISSMTSVVRSAALGVASGAVSAIRTAWDENSPSRVGTDLGMFFDLGIAGGFKAYSKVVNQNAADMGQGAVNSAQSALNLLKTNVEGIDATPTIRPIIDMTDVNNGVNTINGLFNANRTIRAGMFSGGAIGSNAFNRTYDRTQVVNATSNNRDVVQAINSLSNKFNNLSNAVSDMRVYIDSNTLVGRITPMVNRALGRVQARNNRGNNS